VTGGVGHAQPVERAAHRHGLAQVVVRNLALRTAHRRGDGLAHLDRALGGRRRGTAGGGAVDVLARDRAIDAAAGDARQVHAQFQRTLPGRR
jgi:hypothetical protein